MWYGHIVRSSAMSKMILQGTVSGSRRKRKTKCTMGRQCVSMDKKEPVRAAEPCPRLLTVEATRAQCCSAAPLQPRRVKRLRKLREVAEVKEICSMPSVQGTPGAGNGFGGYPHELANGPCGCQGQQSQQVSPSFLWGPFL